MTIKQKGIGLIEVLISTVVIALGLLAVASMQGNFYSSSGDSKTRAEALVLAEREMERQRNIIQKSDYTNLPNPVSPVTGVNNTFTINKGTAVVTAPDRKQITITVSWDGGGEDKQIIIRSEIVFSDPANSVALSNSGEASAGAKGKAPNPNQNSSASVEDSIDLFNDDSSLQTGITAVNGSSNLYTANGDLYRDDGNNKTGTHVYYCDSLGLSSFDIDLINPLNYDSSGVLKEDSLIYLQTKRVNLDSISGNESIELYRKNYALDADSDYVPDGSCTLEHQYFGGVIITVKGTVRTLFDLDDIKIDFNKEDMFCVFNPNPGISISESPYACYVGGNCNYGPNGDNSNFNTCPNPFLSTATVGAGGFSGNVGLLNLDDDGGGKESICYAEEIAGTNTTFSTARKYKTLNSGLEQGINESYSCQDFFIVGRQANASRLAAECAAEVGTLNLPPKEVIRSLTNVNNTVVSTNNATYCISLTPRNYTLLGTISNVAGTISTVTIDGGVCTLTDSNYECTGLTSGSALRVDATSSTSQTGNCTTELSINVDTGNATGSCNIALISPPTYTVTGDITGLRDRTTVTVTVTDLVDGSTPVDCTVTSNTSYSCTISTNEPSIRMEAFSHPKNAACTIIDLSANAGESINLPDDVGNGTCTLGF